METVHNYIDVHKMKPIEMPTFSIISDDETVVAEICPDCIENFDISNNNLSFTTNIFFYLNNPEWSKEKETSYIITYNQKFKNPQTDEIILLEHKYNNMYHNHYSTYGNNSFTHEVTYSYCFVDKNLYNRLEKQEEK